MRGSAEVSRSADGLRSFDRDGSAGRVDELGRGGRGPEDFGRPAFLMPDLIGDFSSVAPSSEVSFFGGGVTAQT